MLSSKAYSCLRLQWLSPSSTYHVRNLFGKTKNQPTTNEEEEQFKPPSFADDEINESNEVKINTDRSRLLPQHLRILNNQRPYDEPHSWIHKTEKYQRKLYGRYGAASGVDPRICFPTKEDIQNQEEYERVAYPYTLEQMIEINKKKKEATKAKILKREEEIEKKLEKLEHWKAELNTKIAKKEADALEAKQRKERLIEEVRRHFGFKIDPRDDRFKEMLEQKEKEDKKKQKEAKRKAKEEKMMDKMINMTTKNAPVKSKNEEN